MKVWSPVWVNISWIDDSSCWIICRSDEDVENIKMIHKMVSTPQFKLQSYDDYKQNAAKQSESVASDSSPVRSRSAPSEETESGKQYATAAN